MSPHERHGLAAFFVLLEFRDLRPAHTLEWVDWIGEPAVRVLQKRGVLFDCGEATYYPCPSPLGLGCRRYLEDDIAVGATGRIALCGQGNHQCDPVPVRDEDLRMLDVSRDALVLMLQDFFGMESVLEPPRKKWWKARALGVLAGKPTYLATATNSKRLWRWIAKQRQARIIVPTTRLIRTDRVFKYAPGEPVELLVLEDVFSIDDNKLVLRWEPSKPVAADVVEVDGSADTPIGEAFSHEGRRPLSQLDCRELCKHREKYHLFLNRLVPRGRPVRAWRLLDSGQGEVVKMNATDAAVIVELVRARRPLREGDFRTLRVTHVAKAVEQARRLLDVKTAGTAWRSIQTSHDAKQAKTWEFAPEDGVRWLVIDRLAT